LPNASGICGVFPSGNSSYNAAQLTFEHRYSKGLEVAASYTFSSNLNNFSDPSGGLSSIGLVLDSPRYDWGNSDVAIRHILNVTASYNLPFASSAAGVSGAFFKGWRLSTIAYYNTGLPFTVYDGAFPTAPSNIPGFSADRPSVVPGQSLSVPHPTINEWFNINAFAVQPFGTPGNEHRGQLWGPPNRRIDLSLSKAFTLREPWTLRFGAEAYNVLNWENFSQPNTTIAQFNPDGTPSNAGSFGQVTATRTGAIPRVFQFELRLAF
jgi:hypothetical protein